VTLLYERSPGTKPGVSKDKKERILHLNASLVFPKIYKIACRFSEDVHDVQDIAQDAYLKAFLGFEKFRYESELETWLYKIVLNCAYSHFKKKNRAPWPLADFDSEAGFIDGPEVVFEKKARVKELLTLINELPKDLRLVLVLKDIYGLNHHEICQALNISKATSKVRLHRARKTLKSLLCHKGVLGSQL
jgi:RNA polymerase sigma-70 factor (ECF subfamily)